MSVINLGRTTKTNIVFYQTDGMGRDGYITYNNGGFWKNRQIKLKDIYNPPKKITIFHSLIHQPAPFNYISDGSGRDSYVIEHNGGLVKDFEPLFEQKLPKFLRKNEDVSIIKHKLFLTKSQRRYLSKIKKIQDGVVHRLYKDSIEKTKKNNIKHRKHRNKSFNNLLISKEKINSLTGIMTPMPAIENNRSRKLNNLLKIEKLNLENQSNSSINDNISQNKNIFEKTLKKRVIYKENSAQNIGMFNSRNNNRNIEVLKKTNVNSQSIINRSRDNIINEKNNIFKFYNNFSSKYRIKPTNNMRVFGNNTLGYSSQANSNTIKYRNKGCVLKSENFSMNDNNKNCDYRYEY